MYDINEDNFQNVNDLLACDTPYTIVQANDINDANEISATAVIFRERRNIVGEIDLDDQGNVIPSAPYEPDYDEYGYGASANYKSRVY